MRYGISSAAQLIIALVCAVTVLPAPCSGAAPATQPASKPSTKPAAHDAASDVAGPTVLPKARLRIGSPPEGWKLRKTDATSGTVVTYHERGENGLIIVSVRPLPAEAKKDPKVRDVVVDEMIKQDQAGIQMPGAKEKDKPQVISDSRFLRKTVRKYDMQGSGYQVVSRQILVGDALVSVSSLAPDERADAIDGLADTVATSAKPLGR